MIFSTDSLLKNTYVNDNGELKDKIIANAGDSKDYIRSAENYLEYGVFGSGKKIGYRRTIGYPMIISFFKWSLEKKWFIGLIIFQIIISSFIYPTIYSIGKIILGKDSKSVFYATLLILIFGAFFTRVPYVLTDLTFATFFLIGLNFSLLSVTNQWGSASLFDSWHTKINKVWFNFIPRRIATELSIKRSWLYFSGAIVFLSYSSLIRPTLIIYFVINFFLLLAMAKKYNTWQFRNVRWKVWLSTFILLFSCNISSFRLYQHYGVFQPTDVLGINMFDYNVEYILYQENKKDLFLEYDATIKSANSFVEKDKLRKKFFFSTISEYPKRALIYWSKTFKAHLLSPHWLEIGYTYGIYIGDPSYIPLVNNFQSYLLIGILYVFLIFNLFFIIIPFSLYIIRLCLNREILLAVSIVLFCSIMVGPSLIAGVSTRMRMPIEPFLVLLAFDYLYEKYMIFKGFD